LANHVAARPDEEEVIMPARKSFRETVQARARRDAKFRRALLADAPTPQLFEKQFGASARKILAGKCGNPPWSTARR
jgi:hypothetical protein